MGIIWTAIQGFCMAMADAVPGVSGGTIAFVMGFYDRFLADYNGMKLGLCYDNCMSESFCHDSYDISVDKVFTDKDIYTINTKERK